MIDNLKFYDLISHRFPIVQLHYKLGRYQFSSQNEKRIPHDDLMKDIPQQLQQGFD